MKVIRFPAVPLIVFVQNSFQTPAPNVTESPAATLVIVWDTVSQGKPTSPELASFPVLVTK
jgi:hypothetical protein